MDGFLLPSGMCTKVGIAFLGWLLTSSLSSICSPEGAMVLGLAGEWWWVGEDVEFSFQGARKTQ